MSHLAELLAASGVAGRDDRTTRLPDGAIEAIGRATSDGETYVAGGDLQQATLVACVPLKLDGRITGYIAICRLLAHKNTLEPLDHELFDLLATHAATALYCTALHERVERLTA